MLAGMLLGLGASASWALANVVVQRAGRAQGALPGLFWMQVAGLASPNFLVEIEVTAVRP